MKRIIFALVMLGIITTAGCQTQSSPLPDAESSQAESSNENASSFSSDDISSQIVSCEPGSDITNIQSDSSVTSSEDESSATESVPAKPSFPSGSGLELPDDYF